MRRKLSFVSTLADVVKISHKNKSSVFVITRLYIVVGAKRASSSGGRFSECGSF